MTNRDADQTPPAGASSPGGVTEILLAWSAGDEAALHALLPLVHERLRQLARGYLNHERPNHTLEPNALVNEVYLRLIDQKQVSWRDRAHFFGAAAQIMRRVLVDHARRKNADKRGGSVSLLPIEAAALASAPPDPIDVLILDEAMQKLARIFPEQSTIVEMRFFAGLTIEETAEAMGISPSTVNREWTMARAWLYRAMNSPAGKKTPRA